MDLIGRVTGQIEDHCLCARLDRLLSGSSPATVRGFYLGGYKSGFGRNRLFVLLKFARILQ